MDENIRNTRGQTPLHLETSEASGWAEVHDANDMHVAAVYMFPTLEENTRRAQRIVDLINQFGWDGYYA